ncbi:hypothetical protein l11_12960 [Neisseria weaveri LMG 5135]|nr:hypothetical protein l11_12960 [Neisseria weaveri LMG 5135]
MLKPPVKTPSKKAPAQPPSGGCVLKLIRFVRIQSASCTAAFGRLCVETGAAVWNKKECMEQPPSGGCVLKLFA